MSEDVQVAQSAMGTALNHFGRTAERLGKLAKREHPKTRARITATVLRKANQAKLELERESRRLESVMDRRRGFSLAPVVQTAVVAASDAVDSVIRVVEAERHVVKSGGEAVAALTLALQQAARANEMTHYASQAFAERTEAAAENAAARAHAASQISALRAYNALRWQAGATSHFQGAAANAEHHLLVANRTTQKAIEAEARQSELYHKADLRAAVNEEEARKIQADLQVAQDTLADTRQLAKVVAERTVGAATAAAGSAVEAASAAAGFVAGFLGQSVHALGQAASQFVRQAPDLISQIQKSWNAFWRLMWHDEPPQLPPPEQWQLTVRPNEEINILRSPYLPITMGERGSAAPPSPSKKVSGSTLMNDSLRILGLSAVPSHSELRKLLLQFHTDKLRLHLGRPPTEEETKEHTRKFIAVNFLRHNAAGAVQGGGCLAAPRRRRRSRRRSRSRSRRRSRRGRARRK